MPAWHPEPALLPFLPCGPAWGAEGVPRAPPLVIDRGWVASALASSSCNDPPPLRAPAETRRTTRKGPASSPRPGGSVPLQISPATSGVEDEPRRSFERARKRGTVCHELFREAMGVLSRLGEELVDVDAALRPRAFGWWTSGVN